jgi:uncharacterized protein
MTENAMSNPHLDTVVNTITPEIYQAFKSAVAIRRWPNGLAMTEAQLATCLQAMIAYEHHYLPAEERTGYVPPKNQACADENPNHGSETPLKWQH